MAIFSLVLCNRESVCVCVLRLIECCVAEDVALLKCGVLISCLVGQVTTEKDATVECKIMLPEHDRRCFFFCGFAKNREAGRDSFIFVLPVKGCAAGPP